MMVPPTQAPVFIKMEAREAGAFVISFWVSMKVVYESWDVCE